MAPRTFGMDEFDSAQPMSPAGTPYGTPGVSRGMSAEEFESAVPKRDWSTVGKEAAKNALPSLGGVLVDTVQPLLHPVQTYESFRDLGHGLLQKAGAMSGDDHTKNVDALVNHFADKYGGWDQFKNTLATDPASVLADASLALTGGGALLRGAGKVAEVANASKTASALGAAGRGVQTAGAAIDPLNAVIAPAKIAGAVAPHVIGAMAHTGDVPLKEAAAAGFKGGQSARDFVENIKGTANTEDAVRDALTAVEAMHKEARDAYNAGMIPVRNDKRVLQFNDINQAIRDANKVASFKGVPIHPSTKAIRDEIKQRVRDWERLPPGQYHTAEGLDALKQHIGELYDTVKPFSREKAVLDKVYSSVWKTIQAQAPSYANVMKGFETARESIRQLQQELSLPGRKKTNISTALNKLQSTMRNNVNTNYGRRSQLMQRLAAHGADINPKLAGQNLQAWVPRGLGRLGMQLAVHGGLAAGAGSVGGLPAAALVGATLPLMSPRLMGNAFYRSGQMRRLGKNVPARALVRGAYQADQLNENNPYAP